MPAVTGGCFRVGFFFSFFGRIVSVLPFVRRLTLEPCTPAPGTSGACGIEVTVSVSTVMLCNDRSPVLVLVTPCLMQALDWRVVRGGALAAPLRRPPLMLSVSLPLSLALVRPLAAFLTSPSGSTESAPPCDASEMMLSSSFSPIDASGPPRGDPIGLTSWTVSRVEVLPPPPRAGVLTPPPAEWASSPSVSDCRSGGGSGGVGRWRLIRGGSGSGLRGRPMLGLWRMGGGERRRGETGHLGDSRRCSIAVGDFIGAVTLEALDSEAEGRRVGVLADERVLEPGAGDGLAAGLAGREGLRSCWLFFLERMPELADEVREVAVRERGRVGEGSREARGDWAAEDEVEADTEAAAEGSEVNLEGPDSVMGVIVAVLAEDSRERAGFAAGASDPAGDMFGDLSMSACEHEHGGRCWGCWGCWGWRWDWGRGWRGHWRGHWRGLDGVDVDGLLLDGAAAVGGGEEWRLGAGHTCHKAASSSARVDPGQA